MQGLSNPWQHNFLVLAVETALSLFSPAPSSPLASLRDYLAKWSVGLADPENADWDASYCAEYRLACQGGKISGNMFFYDTYASVYAATWGGTDYPNPPRPKDGNGPCGSLMPSQSGNTHSFFARATLSLLNASPTAIASTDRVAAACAYVRSNLAVSVAHNKVAFAEKAQARPQLPSISPLDPWTAAPTSPTPQTIPTSPTSIPNVNAARPSSPLMAVTYSASLAGVVLLALNAAF